MKLEEKFMKEEVAAVKIKKNLPGHLARKGYSNLKFVAVVLQTGLRAADARNKFRCRKKNKAAVVIQVSSCKLALLFFLISSSINDLY